MYRGYCEIQKQDGLNPMRTLHSTVATAHDPASLSRGRFLALAALVVVVVVAVAVLPVVPSLFQKSAYPEPTFCALPPATTAWTCRVGEARNKAADEEGRLFSEAEDAERSVPADGGGVGSP